MRNGDKMKTKKYTWVNCKHNRGKGFWECSLDDMKRDFSEIQMGEPEFVTIYTEPSKTPGFSASHLYCSVVKPKLRWGEEPQLFCHSSRKGLEGRIELFRNEEVEEV